MTRYLSLFSGIGGFDLGFDRAGMECAGQVEIDDKCRAVLARHWPDTPRMSDIREVTGDEFGTVDVICGGFPCQDVSVAGKRAGLAGERSGLWYEFHRIIDGVKPRWVVIENVPGLLSSHGGRDFAAILRGLVECGYGVAWRVLDAQYFGVAQRRRRVFIVGSLGDGRAAEVLFEREGGAGDIAEGRSAGAGTAPYAIRRAQTSSNGWGIQRDVTHTLDGTGGDVVSYVMAHGQANAEIVRDGSPSLTLNHEVPIVTTAFNGRNMLPNDEISPTLGAKSTGGYSLNYTPFVMAFSAGNSGDSYGIGITEDGTPPLRGGNSGTNMTPTIAGRFGVRRLTPVECERLQGFPDGWTASGWIHPSPEYIAECARKGQVPERYVVQAMSDSTRYRQLGNAVAVPVAEWLGRRIMEVERGER